MKNIELKARKKHYESERVARKLGAEFVREIQQRDTYLKCSTGKLKIRRVEGEAPQLIWYDRPDRPEPRESNYEVHCISEEVARTLERALGISKTVSKTRRLYLWQGVRIHIDSVNGLGEFIEFEAVIPDAGDQATASSKIHFLREHFELSDENMIPVSYSDLPE